MTALGQESAQLQEAYPDSADDIAAKQDEIVTAWGNLKDKVRTLLEKFWSIWKGCSKHFVIGNINN